MHFAGAYFKVRIRRGNMSAAIGRVQRAVVQPACGMKMLDNARRDNCLCTEALPGRRVDVDP
jgi:hypothetical protein